MNPYEILGISENATDEEVKKAYKELVKKYHPDKYVDNPLSDLAAEKIKEINIAYDTIMKQRKAQAGSSSYGEQGYNGSALYKEILVMINSGNLAGAESKLQAVPVAERSAEWYFCYGEICKARGWFDNARTYYTTAVNMDPSNRRYRAALNGLYNYARGYTGGSAARGYNDSDQLCRVCQTLYCLDCLCECMGGDCIRCC
ncbi:MAG: J domain-containing protein [Ruminococcaceae bacterium]|nr:J domain-containing protein [Oscillospiraceae bacterium]